jgi:ankyrin repeat protein
LVKGSIRLIAAILALSCLAAPALAQNSQGYAFLKAVKDRDGTTVTNMLSEPGSTVVNTRDSHDETVLHLLVHDRDSTWLAFMLAKGARVDVQNQQGNTPLALAAQLGWIEGAQALLDRRASVDLANQRGETPLILAVHNNDIAMVRLLLSNGADPGHSDSAAGYSALDYAKRDAHSAQIVKLLELAPRPAAKSAMGPS